MPYYESVLIARQDLSNTQAEALGEQFTGVITENGGKVAKTEYWGLKTIAYKIKKNRKAHYLQLTIDAPSEAIHEMERQLGLNEDVLRSLTVRTEELDLEPSVMMQVRSSRDDRPGRDDRGPRRDDRGPKPEAKPVAKPEAKPEAKAEAKPEVKAEAAAEAPAEAKAEAAVEAPAEAKAEAAAEAPAEAKTEEGAE